MIKIILRFDDPSATSNHLLESEIIECLGSVEAKATFAVIPFKRPENQHDYTDNSWAKHLVRGHLSGITEIALHGYSHEIRGHLPQGSPTEFAGIAAASQETMIKSGAERLREIFGENSVTGFILKWSTKSGHRVKAVKCHNEVRDDNRSEKEAGVHGRFQAGCRGPGH